MMWQKGHPGALLVGMWIGVATMENSREDPPKIKNRTIPWSSNLSSGNRARGNEIAVSERYLDGQTCGHYAKWSQSQKDKYYMLSFLCESEKAKLREIKQMVAGAGGHGEMLLKGYKLPAVRW